MQEDINIYNQDDFEEKSKTKSWYKTLIEKYDVVSFEPELDTSMENPLDTPRGVLTSSVFDASILYYLEYLVELNPNKIYDIGCGCNAFKQCFPNIIGIDVPDSKLDKSSNADMYINLGDKFYKDYFEKMESAYAINSLHFCPLSKIRDRVIQFSSLISKGGRGFVTFNVKRMVEYQYNMDSTQPISKEAKKKIELYVRKQLYNLPFTIEVFEVTIPSNTSSPLEIDYSLNGNVKLVFTKS